MKKKNSNIKIDCHPLIQSEVIDKSDDTQERFRLLHKLVYSNPEVRSDPMCRSMCFYETKQHMTFLFLTEREPVRLVAASHKHHSPRPEQGFYWMTPDNMVSNEVYTITDDETDTTYVMEAGSIAEIQCELVTEEIPEEDTDEVVDVQGTRS